MMKKVIYRLFIALIILVIIVNILSIFNLSFFGYRTFRIGSGSMDPYLKVNDFILIKEKEEYKVDDVVTYINESGNYVTHRIIGIYSEDNEVVTKGDANNIEDTPITMHDIVGKVVFRIRGLGFVMYLFSNPISWVLLFIIGLGITMIIPDKKEEEIEEVKEEPKEEVKKEIKKAKRGRPKKNK